MMQPPPQNIQPSVLCDGYGISARALHVCRSRRGCGVCDAFDGSYGLVIWASGWFELMVLIAPQLPNSDDKDGTDNDGLPAVVPV